MIVSLTGTIAAKTASVVVVNVQGVGYELGVSATTSSSLPEVGTTGVTVLTRMVVREGAVDLFGFSTQEERALFDKLVAISHVGPKLALAVLSTFAPSAFVTVVVTGDVTRMATVPGVGKKTASRLIMELSDKLEKDPSLRGIAQEQGVLDGAVAGAATAPAGVEADVLEALLSMGFSSREAELALEGHEDAKAQTTEQLLAYALRRLGGRA